MSFYTILYIAYTYKINNKLTYRVHITLPMLCMYDMYNIYYTNVEFRNKINTKWSYHDHRESPHLVI